MVKQKNNLKFLLVMFDGSKSMPRASRRSLLVFSFCFAEEVLDHILSIDPYLPTGFHGSFGFRGSFTRLAAPSRGSCLYVTGPFEGFGAILREPAIDPVNSLEFLTLSRRLLFPAAKSSSELTVSR